jgi:hypothetical protein
MATRTLFAVFAATVAFGLAAATEASSAPTFNYPWCANYMMQNGPKNCGFTTLEQCRATVSGIGGYCAANPAYVAPVSPHLRPARQGQAALR